MARNSIMACGIALMIVSCTSAVKHRRPISLEQIEQLPLGIPSSEVLKSLGEPHEIRDGEGGAGSLWIYDGPNGDVQRASMSFDSGKRLLSKMVMPDEAEPESKVDFLLKSKFPNRNFVSVNFPQCGMDFISESSVYADLATGLSILYLKTRKEVEALGWSTPAQLKQDLADIASCKGRGKSKVNTPAGGR